MLGDDKCNLEDNFDHFALSPGFGVVYQSIADKASLPAYMTAFIIVAHNWLPMWAALTLVLRPLNTGRLINGITAYNLIHSQPDNLIFISF